MKTFYSTLLFLLYINCCLANVWQGDYIIKTQMDADAFASMCNCTSINGNLIIKGEDIVHVDSLHKLKEVIGSIEIIDNERLNKLDGLNNIRIIEEDLKIHNNSSLINLAGFNSLETIEGRYFEIKFNEHLVEITGFTNLHTVDVIHIESNSKLKGFTVFKKMEQFRQLLIWRNESLSTIRELDRMAKIGRFSVHENNDLKVIGGFNEVICTERAIEISRNPSLHTINSFNKLLRIDDGLTINDNDQLKTINGFDQLEEVRTNFNVKLPRSLVNKGYFKSLRKVEKYFYTNIIHFENLDSVGYMRFANDYLETDTLFGPSGMRQIGQLVIEDNNSLNHITGFEDLHLLQSLRIQTNNSLKTIEGFNQIDSTSMYIHDNRTLRHIGGFEQLKQLKNLTHTLNRNLVSMSAFERVESIQGNCHFNLPHNFLDQKIFKNLKRIDGTLNTNVTNFHRLEYVANIDFIGDVLNSHILSGFKTVKEVGLIDIHDNIKLKYINAFAQLQKAAINIYENENLISIEGFHKMDTVNNNLYIVSNPSLQEISGFDNLKYIEGDFNCQVNPSLTFIDSFNELTKIRDFNLHFNNSLQEISGFKNLKSAHRIHIGNHLQLTTVSLFNNLNHITEYIRIKGNSSLKNIPDFNNLHTLNYIDINSNPNLQKIEGFEKLKYVNEIRAILNNNLISIQGFDQLSALSVLNIQNGNLRSLNAFSNLKAMDEFSLVGNIHLKSIDNFPNIGVINKLRIQYNNQLNQCCLVKCWVNDGVIDPLNMGVTSNGPDCSGMEAIKKACEESPCNIREESLSDLNISYSLSINRLQFDYIVYKDQPVNYHIFNMNDQIVFKGKVDSQKGLNFKTVDIPDLQKGCYFLLVKNEDTKAVAKFMKM